MMMMMEIKCYNYKIKKILPKILINYCDPYPILKCTITTNKSVYALYGLRLLIMAARLMKRSARAVLKRLFVRPIIITKFFLF